MVSARAYADILFLACPEYCADFAEWKVKARPVPTGFVRAVIINSRCEMDRKNEIWLKAMKVGEICGCHQRADRSFFINGWQFPVCARCTGVIIGQAAGSFVCMRKKIPLYVSAICCEATLLDWSLQQSGIKQSTNFRRLLTGICGGFGMTAVYAETIRQFSKFIKRRKHR